MHGRASNSVLLSVPFCIFDPPHGTVFQTLFNTCVSGSLLMENFVLVCLEMNILAGDEILG